MCQFEFFRIYTCQNEIDTFFKILINEYIFSLTNDLGSYTTASKLFMFILVSAGMCVTKIGSDSFLQNRLER